MNSLTLPSSLTSCFSTSSTASASPVTTKKSCLLSTSGRKSVTWLINCLFKASCGKSKSAGFCAANSLVNVNEPSLAKLAPIFSVSLENSLKLVTKISFCLALVTATYIILASSSSNCFCLVTLPIALTKESIRQSDRTTVIPQLSPLII